MRFALVFLSYVICCAVPAYAQDWRAVEITGAVRVITPGEPARAVATQDVLPVGAVVTTGRDGRAVFSNGAARATLSANSRLTLAPSEQGFTRFVQDLGAVLFQVDRQRDPHFEVRTSLVAAVVKGTTFTVSVEPDQHRVFVAEGTVEVSALDGGDMERVTGGGIAEVDRAAPDRVERGEPGAQHGAIPAVALDYAALTGGLLRGRDDAEAETTELVLADASDPAAPADTPATDDDHGVGTGSGDDGAGDDGSGDDSAGDDGTGDDGGDGDVDDGDDGNNGHGNDDDGDDDSNPGNGGNDDDGAVDDDGNNGHGNDDDGDDDTNPGNGGDDDDGAGDDDGNNGHGNDDDGDDDSNPGNGGDDDDDDGNNGHGNGHGGDDDDDGNNGHGNDDDGEDDSNPGRGGRG